MRNLSYKIGDNLIFVSKIIKIIIINNLFYESEGGMSPLAISAVEYRIETREVKARLDWECSRAATESFGYSKDLLFYVLESRLKDSGMIW